jgi:outer membrane protein assembly factor BamB
MLRPLIVIALLTPLPARAGDKLKAEPVWENQRLKAYLTSPVAVKDRLYGLSKRGELVCVDLSDGKTVWAGGDFGNYGTLAAAGETLLVFTSRGELHAVRTGGKKSVRLARWRLTENTPAWSHLAVAGGRLYIKDKTDVLCFDLPGQ